MILSYLPSPRSTEVVLAAVVLFICVSILSPVYGLTQKAVIDSPLLTERVGTNRTIKVDINGNGDFTSVQAAIDSVPSGNSRWVIIHVRKGIYREKVHIPKDKPYIVMRGNGKGRHLCEIFMKDDKRVTIHGSIRVQNRGSKDENSRLFFKGKAYGVENVYLGRAKGTYSRAAFARTYLSKAIVPHGWTNWSYDGSTENLYHAEYCCYCPGAESKDRVAWSRQLSRAFPIRRLHHPWQGMASRLGVRIGGRS